MRDADGVLVVAFDSVQYSVQRRNALYPKGRRNSLTTIIAALTYL